MQLCHPFKKKKICYSGILWFVGFLFTPERKLNCTNFPLQRTSLPLHGFTCCLHFSTDKTKCVSAVMGKLLQQLEKSINIVSKSRSHKSSWKLTMVNELLSVRSHVSVSGAHPWGTHLELRKPLKRFHF